MKFRFHQILNLLDALSVYTIELMCMIMIFNRIDCPQINQYIPQHVIIKPKYSCGTCDITYSKSK